jgi:rod shape-determining protein MreC
MILGIDYGSGMARVKIWLLIISLILILLDKFSFISKFRDATAINIQKQMELLQFRITNYPKLVLLQHSKQKQLELENRQLKKQVEQFSIQIQQQSNQQQDIIEFKDLKAAHVQYDNFTTNIAQAIIDVNYMVNNKLLINKGQDDAIDIGLAVVNKFGVIGQVGVLNKTNSQVILISNQDYKIYLQNSVTKSKMLAQGIGNNKLVVKYIDKNEKIAIGDVLVTTGLDDIYPANLPVAKVIKVFYENNGFNSALCVPVVDFNKLQYVLVLKNAN